jgi:hypothetical protein
MLQRSMGVACCASAKTQVQKLEFAPVGRLLKCKTLVVCANIIVQKLDQSQVNISDPKLPKPTRLHNKKAPHKAGLAG